MDPVSIISAIMAAITALDEIVNLAMKLRQDFSTAQITGSLTAEQWAVLDAALAAAEAKRRVAVATLQAQAPRPVV